MLIMIALYWNHEALKAFGILGKDTPNPFRYFLFLQGKQSSGKYKKHWADIAFVFWHTVWWSLCVQANYYFTQAEHQYPTGNHYSHLAASGEETTRQEEQMDAIHRA